MYIQNDQCVMGITLRYACWGTHRPPPPRGARQLTAQPTDLQGLGQPSPPPPPLCDIPSGCFFLTGPWTVTRSSLRMLRRAAAFCRPLRPVLPLVSFPRSRSPVVGAPGLCILYVGLASPWTAAQWTVDHGGCRQPMCDPEGCATVLGVVERGGGVVGGCRGQ